jgi:hypothetical protein
MRDAYVTIFLIERQRLYFLRNACALTKKKEGFAGDISTRVRMQIRSVSRSRRLSKKEGFGINYSLGTVTPGLLALCVCVCATLRPPSIRSQICSVQSWCAV